MSTEPPIRTDPAAPSGPRPAPRGRLILAWLLTLAVLPYAWDRTVTMWMLVGRPEPPFAALLVVATVAVIALTRSWAGRPASPGAVRLLAWALLLPWLAWNAIIVGLFTGPLLPPVYVLPLFVPASLWVLWFAWMFARPLRPRTRWGVLALLLAVSAGAGALVKAEGLTGDARVNFAWRRQLREREQRVRGAEEAPAGTADLTKIDPDDYPQYLGPQRLGVVPRARLAREWDKHPPRLLWRQPVGDGWGSFAVVNGFALTQEQRGRHECTVCYRVRDGATVWVHTDEARFERSLGGTGPRATPTVAGGRVYTQGATGLLNCLDGATGRTVWSVNILDDNQATGTLSHGVCASPLIVDDRVLVCPTGAQGPSLVAYHRDTGRRLWQAGGQQASYSSPLLAELAGLRQVLLYNGDGLAGHDPETGRVLWSFFWTNKERINCAQPLPDAGGPGQVFLATGYGKGCALCRVERAADGSWAAHAVWENRRPVMRAKFTSPVAYQGHVYGLDEGILACVELKTGRQLWKDGRYGHGQVLLAGGLLLVQAEAGALVLVEPSPDGLRELGRAAVLSGKTWNHPALAGRFLLVRNDQEAACFELPPAGE